MDDLVNSLGKLLVLLLPILGFFAWILKELKSNRREIQSIVDQIVAELRSDAKKSHKRLHRRLDKVVSKEVCDQLRTQCQRCNDQKR